MGERVQVLDHGYVECVETWGSDAQVVSAARQSVGGDFVSWEPYEGHPRGDAGLLSFLWKAPHAGPFEHAGMSIQVQAPLFVLRQWDRHRTQCLVGDELFPGDVSYNEASARYGPLPDVNYVPTVERLMMGGDGKNKQAGTAKGAAVLTEDDAAAFRLRLDEHYCEAEEVYQVSLKCGVPKELARLVLPVGRYSRMRASANLRNWLAFLTLRMATDAQWEIREYANAVGQIIAKAFPRTWDLYCGSTVGELDRLRSEVQRLSGVISQMNAERSRERRGA